MAGTRWPAAGLIVWLHTRKCTLQEEIYGEVHIESAKEKLGKPTIYPESGVVDYLEQSFDDIHIFRFEFLDDEFKELKYFQIDG